MNRRCLRSALVPAALAAALLAAGCGGESLSRAEQRGKLAIEAAGCGGCHTIGGVERADATFGPSLVGIAERRSVAGSLPNDHHSLARWIRDPTSINPNTLMPDLGVSRADADAIATYLETGQEKEDGG